MQRNDRYGRLGLNVVAVASLRSVGPSTTSAPSRSNSVAARDAPSLRRHSPSNTISSARTDGHWGEYYARCRDRGMPHGKALKAVARKRLKVIYAVMRDKILYVA